MYTIYRIVNLVNGKLYVGFTIQDPPEKRFAKHKLDARPNGDSQRYLHRAIRKYGKENFSFTILKQGEDHEWGLKVEEPYHIGMWKPEYNMTEGGDGVLGLTFTVEQRQENSTRQRGVKKAPRTLEHCTAISLSKMGVPKSLQCKEKIGATKIRKNREMREKGIPHPNKGKIRSLVTRLKQRESALRRKR